jgi:hypothetical protein
VVDPRDGSQPDLLGAVSYLAFAEAIETADHLLAATAA